MTRSFDVIGIARKLFFALVLVAIAFPCSGGAAEMPQQAIITLPLSKAAPVVNGDVQPKEYEDAIVLGGDFIGWGVSPRPQSPTVYIKRTQTQLFICYDNPLKEGEYPSLKGAQPDNPGICLGNVMELFFKPHQPDGELLQYVQFAGNARGCVYDALSRPEVGVTYVAEYNKPWGFANSIVPGHWYAEISTLFEDVGVKSTVDGEWLLMDIARDGGTGPKGVHSYTMAYHQVQMGKGLRVLFDANAPAVQWLSFGGFQGATFSPRLRLRGMGRQGTYTLKYLLTEAKQQQDKTYKEIYKEDVAISLGRDEVKEVVRSISLKGNTTGVAHYWIVDDKDKTLFYRKLPFECDVPVPPLYPRIERKPIMPTARMAPSFGRIGVAADIIYYEKDKKDVAVKVIATRVGEKKPLGQVVLDSFNLDYAHGMLDVGELKAGKYEVNFQMINKGTGASLGPTAEVKITRTVYEWENSKLGYSDTPPQPWTPVKVAGERVQVWGRSYAFSGAGLPQSIDTMQPNPTRGPKVVDVLASPVRLNAVVAGKPVVWQDGKSRIVSHNANEAVVEGSTRTSGLSATIRGTLEYDGFYKVHLTVTPTGKEVFESITVEVPVSTENALLFHAVGESMRTNKTFADFEGKGDGVLWDSKRAAKNALVKGNFLPVAWLGNEDRGIAWMCDSDRSWQVTLDKPCLDVVRRGKTTVFRIHLLNAAGPLKHPIETTFSLQATPVRPRPAGGSWKAEEWYGWGYFDQPLISSKLDPGNITVDTTQARPWYRTKQAKAENRWWRYGCLASDRISETDPKYGSIVRDFGGEWYCDSIWMKHHLRSHQDFELWVMKRFHDKESMDGVYFDNTFPAPTNNLLNGSAYVDEAGRVRAGYGLMDSRAYLKRLRTMLLSFGPGPVLKAHITDTPIPGTLGLCDFWLDGENGGYPKGDQKTPDFVDRWYNPVGMANLRITLGGQWGTIPMYLYSWGLESTHAVLGMFDLPKNQRWMGEKAYHDFGSTAKDIVFRPYWSQDLPGKVVAGGPDVLLTLWQRPGRTRILISNLSNENRRVTLAFDLARLGLQAGAVIMDEREGSQLVSVGGRVKGVYVSRHDYRSLIISNPGLYAPLSPTLGAPLLPPRSERISTLCDSFETVSDGWQQNASVNVTKATVDHGVPCPVYSIFSGHLQVRTSSSIFANLRRPFKQDHCSVQVKLREPNGNYAPGWGPSLKLLWSEEDYVSIAAWERGKPNFHCTGKVGGKVVFSTPGDVPAMINWVKITLHAETIAFHTSTDGKAWKVLAECPRKGFTGAPAELLLGHGIKTDSHLEGYSFDSYYDDLIVARLKAKKE